MKKKHKNYCMKQRSTTPNEGNEKNHKKYQKVTWANTKKEKESL